MNIVTIENLAFAYRKAKVDLFYSGNPRRIDLLEFEKELEKNLNAIKKAYENNDESFFLNISNGYWYYPKSTISSSKKNNNILIISDSNGKGKSCRIKSYEVRVLERLPIAFHVITTLWIDSVGTKMDSMLSKSSYGNRIKQNKRRFSLGTFFPYPSCYRKWRGDAIESIRAALNKKKNVIAITTDFSAFYHSINPGFILEPAFQKKLGLCLNDEQKRFTRLIIRMLDRWAETTPLKRGLPVGCSISSVIANLALAFFDQSVEKKLKPLFYGRYVDDIILAIENTNGLSRQKDIWSWIQNRILCLSERYPDSMYPAFPHHDYTSKDHIINKKNMRNKILYLDYGKEYQELEKIDFGYLVFKKEKTKFFVLDYQSGTTFLDLLEKQIKEMSSEWRLLPELPEDQHIPSMLLSVSTRTGEDSDTLRSSDSISMRRAMFSIKMRDFESYCRDLSPKSWEKQRHAFLKTIYLYFTSPDVFFEYIRFFPRILSVAVECEDYSFIHLIISSALRKCMALKEKPCVIAGKDGSQCMSPIQFRLFLDFIATMFYESIVSSLPGVDNKRIEIINGIIKKYSLLRHQCEQENRIESLYNQLFAYDLAKKEFCLCFNPYYKTCPVSDGSMLLPSYCYSKDEIKHPLLLFIVNKLLQLPFKELFCIWPVPDQTIPKAFLFPTRPFHVQDLCVITKKPIQNSYKLSLLLYVLYGDANRSIPVTCSQDSKTNIKTIEVKKDSFPSPISVALTSWKTSLKCLYASLKGKSIWDSCRHYRLYHLVNQILKCNHAVDYVVFPELAIPPLWFLSMSQKLQRLGISLIGGVEYIHKEADTVSNQVWCSLNYKQSIFSQSVIVIHEKDAPAFHEKEIIKKISKRFDPAKCSGNPIEIIKHGDFYFGVLICSELTNIDYRAGFRGRIDALFVPECNPDTTMFGALVESAAYDIHAYIVQCNNRIYGDTRIRVPAKQNYNRDLVQVKGGEEDYYVVGELDIYKLRTFQWNNSSSYNNEDPFFKPVPAGFQIAKYRIINPGNRGNK